MKKIKLTPMKEEPIPEAIHIPLTEEQAKEIGNFFISCYFEAVVKPKLEKSMENLKKEMDEVFRKENNHETHAKLSHHDFRSTRKHCRKSKREIPIPIF